MQSRVQTGPPGGALVTGAMGFLGRWLVPALATAGRPVVAAVREPARRADAYRRWVADHGGDPALVTFVEHDLLRPFTPDTDAVRDVVDVYHLAARYAWGLAPDAAARANVEGTLQLLRWAATLPHLRRFVLVAGYRVALPAAGGAGSGAYERSKRAQHDALVAEADQLGVPWTVLNPSAVMGDSRTGETTQFIGPAELLRLLFERRLPAVPGSRRTFLPLLPVDDFARFAAAIPTDPESARRSYWILDECTPPALELVEAAARHLGVRAPRHTAPVALVRALPRALSGADPEALEFFASDRYDVSAARAFAERRGLSWPDAAAALGPWLDALVGARFGAGPASFMPGRMESGVWIRRAGNGIPIVLVHGLPLDGEAWRDVASGLDGQLIVPDVPGMGRSGDGDPLDPGWLDRIVDGLREPALVVGHSLGAGIALQLAARRPGKVRSLVLVSPFFLGRTAPAWQRSTTIARAMLALSSKGRLARMLHPDGAEHPAVASALGLLERRGATSALARALSAAANPRWRRDLAALLGASSVPVHLISGSADPLAPGAAAFSATIIEGAGHWPLLTHPEAVAPQIRAAAATTTPARLVGC